MLIVNSRIICLKLRFQKCSFIFLQCYECNFVRNLLLHFLEPDEIKEARNVVKRNDTN